MEKVLSQFVSFTVYKSIIEFVPKKLLKMQIYLFAIIALVAFSASLSYGEEIKATAVLFRHGERTPLQEFPPVLNSAVADLGNEQLTRVSLSKDILKLKQLGN